MCSISETGHAVNLGNAGEAIDILKGIGTDYEPTERWYMAVLEPQVAAAKLADFGSTRFPVLQSESHIVGFLKRGQVLPLID